MITSSIEDLKTVNAEMATQSTAITELISNLEEKRTALEAAMYQNTALIEKLQAAFAE